MLKLLGQREMENILLDFIQKTEKNQENKDALMRSFFCRKTWVGLNISVYYIKNGAEIYQTSLDGPDGVYEITLANRFDTATRSCVVRLTENVVSLHPQTKQTIVNTTFDGVVAKRQVKNCRCDFCSGEMCRKRKPKQDPKIFPKCKHLFPRQILKKLVTP